MEFKATEFRRDLFNILERALHGEPVEITYKGSRLNLSPFASSSKLAGAVRRHALLVDPQSIVESDMDLMADLEAGWIRDDKNL